MLKLWLLVPLPQADKKQPAHSIDDDSIIQTLIQKLADAAPSLPQDYRLNPIQVRIDSVLPLMIW